MLLMLFIGSWALGIAGVIITARNGAHPLVSLLMLYFSGLGVGVALMRFARLREGRT